MALEFPELLLHHLFDSGVFQKFPGPHIGEAVTCRDGGDKRPQDASENETMRTR